MTLELRVVGGNDASDISLHRLLQDWGEGASSFAGGQGAPSEPGDATWIHSFFDTSSWTTAGGDFAATATATSGVDPSISNVGSWSSIPLLADVQAALDDPASYFGWILIGDESTNGTTLTFGSREQLLSTDRPSLTLNYVPEPATGLQLAVGLALLATQRRRARA